MELRDYQREAVDTTWTRLAADKEQNPCIVLPTGSGKSPVIATLAAEAVQQWGARVMILTHVKELINQLYTTIGSWYPGNGIGVYSAGLNRRDTDNRVVIAGIQSVYKRAHEFGRRHLTIIDEAHLIPEHEDGMFRQFIGDICALNPNHRVIGLTATPYRTGAGEICAPDNVLNYVSYQAEIAPLIAQGFLSRLQNAQAAFAVDTRNVRLVAGEFAQGEVEELFMNQDNMRAAAQIVTALERGREAALVFCSGVRHAKRVAELLRQFGVPTGLVYGDLPPAERDEQITKFLRGEYKALCNVNVLTTGFDATHVDLVAVLRATTSPGLFYQMCGRGFRLHPGKEDCVAAGQEVLTDHGLIEIQNVTTDMKVWDGLSFVKHCGIIYKGERDVISYLGLTATEDHNVWTKEGWKTLRECADQQISICETGNGELPVRETEGFNWRDHESRGEEPAICDDCLHKVRKTEPEVLSCSQEPNRWMQEVRESSASLNAIAGGSEVAANAVHCSEAEVYEPEGRVMEQVRREGHQVLLQEPQRNGEVDSRQPGTHEGPTNRQNQQQRRLRAGEPQSDNGKSEHEQPAQKRTNEANAQVQDTSSRCHVCGCNTSKIALAGTDVPADCNEIQKEVVQTKRPVWDILNAGPNHRFTVSGLLVSNCLVLDFGGNIERHGALDSPDYGVEALNRWKAAAYAKELREKARVKECPACGIEVAVQTKTCVCGFEFPPSMMPVDPDATNPILQGDLPAPEWYEVHAVDYDVHYKSGWTEGDPITMKVSYHWSDGLKDWPFAEWVCFEHKGFARGKAEKWWKARSYAPVPDTTEEAVFLCTQARVVAEPTEVFVGHDTKNPKYKRIFEYKMKDIPDYNPEAVNMPKQDNGNFGYDPGQGINSFLEQCEDGDIPF